MRFSPFFANVAEYGRAKNVAVGIGEKKYTEKSRFVSFRGVKKGEWF